MSVQSAVDPTFASTRSPSSSDMAELTNRVALTPIQDDNGNNLDPVPGDLGPAETEDSGFSSEGGAEYDLADHIDRLTLLAEREVDISVLEEFGADKRARTQGQEGEEEVPAKRPPRQPPTTLTRPPPDQAPFLGFGADGPTCNSRRMVGARQQGGGQRLPAPVVFPAANGVENTAFNLGNVLEAQGSAASSPGDFPFRQGNVDLHQGTIPSRWGNVSSNLGVAPSGRQNGLGDSTSSAGTVPSQSAALLHSAASRFPLFGERSSVGDEIIYMGSEHPPARRMDMRSVNEPSSGCTGPTWGERPPSGYSSHFPCSPPSASRLAGMPVERAVYPGSPSDLPAEVDTDGAVASSDEKHRKIEQIMQSLMSSVPQKLAEDCANALPRDMTPFVVGMHTPPRPTGPAVTAQSPICNGGSSMHSPTKLTSPPDFVGKPVEKASSTPVESKDGKSAVSVWQSTPSAAAERQARCYSQLPGTQADSIPTFPPDKCRGPPPIPSTGPFGTKPANLCVGSPETLQGNGPAQVTQNGPAKLEGKGQAVQPMAHSLKADPQSGLPPLFIIRATDSNAAFSPSATKEPASAGGSSNVSPLTLASLGQRCRQRQDSSSSSASSSSARSVRSSSGQTRHTCLSSMAACGGVVTCNDMSPPPPVSPFSPSYGVSKGHASANSPPSASVSGPASPFPAPASVRRCTYPPDASPSSLQLHVSPGAYSFPPTPDSDCQSTKGDCQSPAQSKPPQDFVTSPNAGAATRPNLTPEQAFSPGVTKPAGIGCAGLPTPPHTCSGGDPASPHLANVPPSFGMPSQVCRPYPQPSPCEDDASPDDTKDAAVPPLFVVGECGKVEEVKEEVEEEEVDFESSVLQEVLDSVCDERGVWLTDTDGDNFFHSLPGMKKEGVAVQYLHRLRCKPNFLQALNSYNKSLETPLYSAVCLRKVGLVAHMLQAGADVNIHCRYGEQAHTPLHRAVERGEAELVDLLLQPDNLHLNARRGSDHCTALMVALMRHKAGDPHHNRLCVITRIMEEDKKLDLDACDPRSGNTALMMAVETKDARAVDALLDDLHVDTARRLINMQNRAGNSALHFAAGLRGVAPQVKEYMLRKLIQLGGDTNKRNNEGETPKHWAQQLIDKVARLR